MPTCPSRPFGVKRAALHLNLLGLVKRAPGAEGEPGEDGEHAEPTEEVCGVADLLGVREDVPGGEENFPIVIAGAD